MPKMSTPSAEEAKTNSSGRGSHTQRERWLRRGNGHRPRSDECSRQVGFAHQHAPNFDKRKSSATDIVSATRISGLPQMQGDFLSHRGANLCKLWPSTMSQMFA